MFFPLPQQLGKVYYLLENGSVGFGIKNKILEAMAAGTPVVESESKAPLRERSLEGLKVDGDNVPGSRGVCGGDRSVI